ncbi:MAG: hypothetical protein QM736_20955 [Vicinamibacterales bacterium]
MPRWKRVRVDEDERDMILRLDRERLAVADVDDQVLARTNADRAPIADASDPAVLVAAVRAPPCARTTSM